MGRYVLRRLVQALPLLFAISVASFAILKITPGGPLAAYEGNPDFTEADRLRLEQAFGLDRPLPVQYLSWLGSFLTLDWGYSFSSHQPVLHRRGLASREGHEEVVRDVRAALEERLARRDALQPGARAALDRAGGEPGRHDIVQLRPERLNEGLLVRREYEPEAVAHAATAQPGLGHQSKLVERAGALVPGRNGEQDRLLLTCARWTGRTPRTSAMSRPRAGRKSGIRSEWGSLPKGM